MFSQTNSLENNIDFIINNEYSRQLKFQSQWNDYLVFYETSPAVNKRLYYLRFRIDRWDYENDKNISELVSGEEYETGFVYINSVKSETGLIKSGLMQDAANSKREIRDVVNIVHGKYIKHSLIQIKNIRF